MLATQKNDLRNSVYFAIVGCNTMDAAVAGKAFYTNTDSIIHGRAAANHRRKGNNIVN